MSNDQQHVNQRKEQYQQQREEASIGDASSDDGSTTEEARRTCLYDRFPSLEADYSGKRAVEIFNWALGHHNTSKISLMSVSEHSCGK